VPKDRLVLIYCGVGLRGYLAERILRQSGFARTANLTGGWKTYSTATQKRENAEAPLGYKPSIQEAKISYAEGSGQIEGAPPSGGQRIILDACGLQCPGPIIRLKAEMDKARPGDTLIVRATDPGFAHDAEAWCSLTGNEFRGITSDRGVYEATIVKASAVQAAPSAGPLVPGAARDATLVVFSNDFDRALASFVIANGAAASGKKVTMFFTFWGLSVIKRRERTRVRKDFMGKLFGAMLPKNSGKLSLSKMNFGGIGAKMMKSRMKAKKVDQLEIMMEQARTAGVRMVACQMSMDIMGVQAQELLPGVEIGGVATYLYASESANLTLFV
jgi:peroxiredoxin family protein/TusA-related sulfurtransferase